MPEPDHLGIPATSAYTEVNKTPVNKLKETTPAQDKTGSSNSRSFKEPLFYPLDRDPAYKARIKFVVHKAEPLNVNFANILKFDIFDNVRRLAGVDEPELSPDEIEAQEPTPEGDAARARLAAKNKQIEDTQTEAERAAGEIVKGVKYKIDKEESIVHMFVPISVTFDDVAQYDDAAQLGIVGSESMRAMQQDGSSFLGSALAGLSEGAASIFGLARDAGPEAARLGSIRAAQNPLTPTGVRNAVQIAVQRTLNPNTRPLFRGVAVRQFSFTFRMVATSQAEAITIEKIVEHFRKNVYPETIPDDTEISLAYKFPKAFNISFHFEGGELKIPRLEKCFLRSVRTSFNPTGAVFHKDGRPSEVEMTLSFIERRTLHRKDIEVRGM